MAETNESAGKNSTESEKPAPAASFVSLGDAPDLEPAYYDDKEDQRKSLQNKAKPLCNGAATGCECKHFWLTVLPIDVHNATALRQGEASRLCTLETFADGMRLGREEMPVYCNRYEPSDRPYAREIEDYNPLTPEEIDAVENEDKEILEGINTIKPPKIPLLKSLKLKARRALRVLY